MNISSASRIGIIGGSGRTGSQFARLFQQQGCVTEVTGKETCDRNASLFQTCDIILFSVPLESSLAIIKEEIPHATRPDQLLLDVSSLKSAQVTVMLQGKGDVIGMHPLFAPSTDPTDETIILCPARAADETITSLEAMLQAMKLRTIRKTPEEHDQLMLFIQALPHLKSMLVAETLQTLGADMEEVQRLCTPAYEIELNVIGRFLDDHPDLYGPIIFHNPHTKRMLTTLRDVIDRYIRIADAQDLAAFHDRYHDLQEFAGSLLHHARDRSEACIRTLSSLNHPS